MDGFVDETTIEVVSGHGGSGAVSFHREKFIPRGGPDGGDGGKGGDVVFSVRENLKTLAHLKMKRLYRAENGGPGQGNRRHGRDGRDVNIPVPPGTMIKDPETGELLADCVEPGMVFTLLKGGKGGKGNWHFATSVKQAPRYAQPGLPGESAVIKVELAIIADIGFVGFPNAGKSTLLSVLTNARPKIGDYAFTTKIPNLGVMDLGYKEVILADIPGIIAGASHGAGLGLTFLKHISRTKALVFLLDLSSADCIGAFPTLISELRFYAPVLAEEKRLLVGTKMDIPGAPDMLEKLKAAYPDERILGISSHTRLGLDGLALEFRRLTESV